MKRTEVSLSGLASILERELEGHILPFWRRHGFDPDRPPNLSKVTETL